MKNDFYSDSGALLSKLYGKGDELPAFVKAGEFLVEKEDLDTLDDNSFADPQGRRFPTYDKAATFVSMAYYMASDEEDHDLEGRLKRACTLFNLNSEIKRLGNLIAERKLAEKAHKKSASLDCASDESWAIDVESGNRTLKCAGVGADSFLSACDQFLEIDVRNEKVATIKAAAEEIVHEALRLGGEFYEKMPDDILKLAGYGYPDTDLLESYVGARAIGLPDEHVRKNFINAVHSLKEAAESDIGALPKLAGFLERFDEDYGLRKFYGTKFPDPLRSVHNVSTRKAASLTRKVTVGDHTYYAEELNSPEARKVALYVLGDDDYQSRFQEGFDPRKLAELDESLAGSFNQIFSPGEPIPLTLV